MNRIVGRLLIVYMSCFAHILYGGIRLEMRSTDGIAHNSAIAGQPFLIEAIIDGVQGSVSAPQVEGLASFNARRTGMYMSSINGVSTTKFTYQVRIDKPGNYIIGPARLTHQNNTHVSNTISVTIEHENTSSTSNNKKHKKEELKAFLRLTLDTNHVVVGQKIHGTIRFYYQNPATSLLAISKPDVTGFDIRPIEKPVGGTADINGAHYKYAEWQWEMYPTKAGDFVIPAYSADYEVPEKNSHMLGSFFMLMGNRTNRKRVYSNAAKITVDPLPQSDTHVTAIGTFENFHAHIKPAVAKEGEGMLLTLELTGNGNMPMLVAPTLVLPSALKYYESHTHIADIPQSGMQTKQFEFIVQGMESGDWEIPEQSFTYFDIHKRTYVTLKTSPIAVSIQPGMHKTAPILPEVIRKRIDEERSVGDLFIAPLNTKGPWFPLTSSTHIPWIFFYGIMCFCLLYCAYPLVHLYAQRFAVVKRREKKHACRNARKKVEQSALIHNEAQLYAIFMELSKNLAYESSAEALELLLENAGFPDDMLEEWRTFFDTMACEAYAPTDKNKNQDLFRMAIQWLEHLEKAV